MGMITEPSLRSCGEGDILPARLPIAGTDVQPGLRAYIDCLPLIRGRYGRGHIKLARRRSSGEG